MPPIRSTPLALARALPIAVRLALGLALAAALPAALPAAAHAQQPPPPGVCLDTEKARELDFWIGTWDVVHPEDGRLLGVNTIESLLDGCLLLENWASNGGSSGKSMNFYDPQRQTWRQVWVSDRGEVLDYRAGELRGSTMDFRGITLSPTGDTTFQKLLFESVAPDTVRQTFQESKDRGASWDTTWVGLYIRRPGGP